MDARMLERGPKHIAFHVRRGDHELFNHDQFLEETKLTKDEKRQLKQAWANADKGIEVQLESSISRRYPKLCGLSEQRPQRFIHS